jgi:hypothetical protein
MPDQTAPVTTAAPDPAVQSAQPTAPATPDPTVEVSRLQNELRDFRSREGRFRNEKGVMQARIRELESLALSSTGEPEYGQLGGTPAYPGATPTYGSPYAPPAPTNFVSREEFDLWRVEREFNNPQKLEQVRQIALDGGRVGDFVSWDVDPSTGQPFRSVYKTYKRIAEHLELEDLRKQRQQVPSNPNHAVISGSGASAVEPAVNLDNASWKDMAAKGLVQADENDPPSFARNPASGDKPWFPGRR